MPNRILIGSSPVAFKISKPGFDVLSAGEDDLLLSLSNPALMIIAAGRLTMVSGVAQTVLWPYTLPVAPVVDVQRSLNSDNTRNLVPYRATTGSFIRVFWTVNTTQMTITANGATVVSYVAVTRGQG